MQNGFTLERLLHERNNQSPVVDYLIMATLVTANMYIYFFVAYDRVLKIEAATIFVLLYILWGIWHHHRDKTLTWDILLEYGSFGTFLLAIFFLLLLF